MTELPIFDPLPAFARWWTSLPPIPCSPLAGFTQVGPFMGLILYRDPPWQVQLWLCPPNTEVAEHSHPNVDSIQVYVSGQVWLTLNKQPAFDHGAIAEENGICNMHGWSVRVRPTDTHGAKIGPLGGAFLTVQKWLKGEPQSVEKDWDGPPIDELHKDELHKAYLARLSDMKASLRDE